MMGPGRAFDPAKFFIICCNVLGSPYGTASPVTLNPDTNVNYGPEFPLATVRDDVRYVYIDPRLFAVACCLVFITKFFSYFIFRLHKLILDDLGVKSVAICIGGSM